MSREAMKQALEWLDRNSWPDFDKWAQEGKEVRNALRQALEQTDTVALTQTNVGIGERAMEAYEAAKQRGWSGVSDERLMKMPDEPVAWESLAWELCADECGEEACTELVWEGGPIPEPWGDRWMKYEGEAKRLIALVQKHTSPQPAAWVGLTEDEIHAIYDRIARQEPYSMAVTRRSIGRAIEQALREKNT